MKFALCKKRISIRGLLHPFNRSVLIRLGGIVHFAYGRRILNRISSWPWMKVARYVGRGIASLFRSSNKTFHHAVNGRLAPRGAQVTCPSPAWLRSVLQSAFCFFQTGYGQIGGLWLILGTLNHILQSLFKIVNTCLSNLYAASP